MTTKLSTLHYNTLCAIRFLEHCTSQGIDQARYDDGRFAQLRDRLILKAHRLANRCGTADGGAIQPLQVFAPEDFVAASEDRRQPVVFRGGASSWPCSAKWSNEYFQQHCSRTEVFNISDHITESGAVRGKTSLGDVIRSFGKGGLYARFVPIIHSFPEILDDLDMTFCTQVIGKRKKQVALWGSKSSGVAIRSHLFVGESGTRTNTHCELTSNLFINVVGRKEWVVCPPSYMFALRSPVTKNPGVFGSHYVSDGSRRADFALAEQLPKYRIVLEPGDVMYLPPFYWHEVKNLSSNISIGLRWYSFADGMRSSKTLNLLSMLATRPSMYRAIKEATEYGKVHGDN